MSERRHGTVDLPLAPPRPVTASPSTPAPAPSPQGPGTPPSRPHAWRGTPRRSGVCAARPCSRRPPAGVLRPAGMTGTPLAAPHALTRRANRPTIRIRCVSSRWSCRRRAVAATSTGTRSAGSRAESTPSGRSGPRSHRSRSAGSRTARRSHRPPADRARLTAARQPNCPKGHSGRSPGRSVATLWVEGTVALGDVRAASKARARCAGSDGQGELAEDRVQLAAVRGIRGDLVVAAAQVLHERVAGGEDPC